MGKCRQNQALADFGGSLSAAIARGLEWAFQGRAIAAARLEIERLPRGALEQIDSAERAFELGDATRSSCLMHGGSAALLAAELYRKSRDWASGSAEPRAAAPESRASETALSERVDIDALRRDAASSLRRAREVRDRLDKLAFARALHLVVLGLVTFGVAGMVAFRDRLFPRENLATSAKSCSSSEHDVYDKISENPASGLLFHTREEDSPWFEYDFEKPTQFSALTLENRTDCCLERATPLVIELSDDGTHYRELVKHSEPFGTWRPEFTTQSARFLRVRVTRRSMLHLRAVRVHL